MTTARHLLLLAPTLALLLTNTQRIRAVIADGRLYRRAQLDRLLVEVEGSVEWAGMQE